jgi:hypothetical protein
MRIISGKNTSLQRMKIKINNLITCNYSPTVIAHTCLKDKFIKFKGLNDGNEI